MEISSNIVRLIHEIGFAAAEEGDLAYAIRIFEGMKAIRPNSVYPHIGFAITLMLTGKASEAFTMLNDLKDKYPDNQEDIAAMMGFALKFSQEDEKADEIFSYLATEAKDKAWKEVAREAIRK